MSIQCGFSHTGNMVEFKPTVQFVTLSVRGLCIETKHKDVCGVRREPRFVPLHAPFT